MTTRPTHRFSFRWKSNRSIAAASHTGRWSCCRPPRARRSGRTASAAILPWGCRIPAACEALATKMLAAEHRLVRQTGANLASPRRAAPHPTVLSCASAGGRSQGDMAVLRVYRIAGWVALAIVAARFAWAILGALDVFSDYHAYYRAAANLRAGGDIYAEGKLLVARDSFDFWTQTDGQYVYPPVLAAALLPLTILDIGQGGLVWLLASVLATAAFVWLAARALGRPVGVYSFLVVASPIWAVLPLTVGIRPGLAGPIPVLLTALGLATSLALATGPFRSVQGETLAALLAVAFARPDRGRHPALQASGTSRAAARPGAPRVILGSLTLLATSSLCLCLPFLFWRLGLIAGFPFWLASPGLVGVLALPLVRIGLADDSTPLRSDFHRVLPIGVATLGATPLLIGLRFGQADIFLLILATLALLAHLGRRDFLAGIALGIAAAVKPPLALYLLYFARKRAWSTILGAGLAGATLGLAPFLFLGRAAFTDWLAIARYLSGGDYSAYPSNQSLRGFLLRAFVGGPRLAPLLASRSLADACWLLGIVIAFALWWWAVSPERQSPSPRAVADYCLTASLILFISPLSEDIHFVTLLVALALLSDRLLRTRHSTPWRALAALALLAFLLPLPGQVGSGTVGRHLTSAPYLCGLLLVTAALLTAGLTTSAPRASRCTPSE